MKQSTLFLLFFLLIFQSVANAALEKFEFKGDIRFRYQVTNSDISPDRQRQRVRFRLNGKWQINDQWTVATRLATGDPDNGHSANHTLEGQGGIAFNLDRAYASFKHRDLVLRFGLFASPFRRMQIYKDILWDGDFSVGGISSSWTRGEFSLHLMEFVQDEISAGSDARGIAGQIAWRRKSGMKPELALAYFTYGDLAGQLAENYSVVEFQASLRLPVIPGGRMALQVFQNPDADRDNLATVVGFEVGTARHKMLKKVYLQWQSVELNAVNTDLLGQDDFLHHRTDFEGFIGGFLLSLAPKTTLKIYAFSAEGLLNDDPLETRYRADLVLKF